MLTPRQRQVLHWAARGKTLEESGLILGISKRTTIDHAIRARDLLKASNIVNSIYVAAITKEIELYPAPPLHYEEKKPLSGRQIQVIQLMAHGYTIELVARMLGLKFAMTVRYLTDARWKLNTSNTAQSVAESLRIGLITIFFAIQIIQ